MNVILETTIVRCDDDKVSIKYIKVMILWLMIISPKR